jgi:hypothetical protein
MWEGQRFATLQEQEDGRVSAKDPRKCTKVA